MSRSETTFLEQRLKGLLLVRDGLNAVIADIQRHLQAQDAGTCGHPIERRLGLPSVGASNRFECLDCNQIVTPRMEEPGAEEMTNG
jgi:hypothetical protein